MCVCARMGRTKGVIKAGDIYIYIYIIRAKVREREREREREMMIHHTEEILNHVSLSCMPTPDT